MTTGVQSVNSTQSAMLVNGVQALLFDQTGHLLGVDTGHRDLGATVAAGALTLSLQPVTMKFRSSTLSTGVYVQRAISTALSLVLPTGASIGAVSAVSSRFIVLALDVAGTVELAVANQTSGIVFDEAGVVATSAISAAATSQSVVYSTTARSGVAYRVVGFVDNTQATAGTYATVPSLVQGDGALAIATFVGFGLGQTWQNMTGARAVSTSYYNTTGKSMMVNVAIAASTAPATIAAFVNGGPAIQGSTVSTVGKISAVTFIVPVGAAYAIGYYDGPATLNLWLEFR